MRLPIMPKATQTSNEVRQEPLHISQLQTPPHSAHLPDNHRQHHTRYHKSQTITNITMTQISHHNYSTTLNTTTPPSLSHHHNLTHTHTHTHTQDHNPIDHHNHTHTNSSPVSCSNNSSHAPGAYSHPEHSALPLLRTLWASLKAPPRQRRALVQPRLLEALLHVPLRGRGSVTCRKRPSAHLARSFWEAG